MKLKRPKLTITSIVVFSVIAALGAARRYKLHHEEKEGSIISQSIEDLKPEDIYTLNTEEIDIEYEEPEVKMVK